MTDVWIVEFIDDNDEKAQKTSFYTEEEALSWIRYRKYADTKSNTHFELMSSPYTMSFDKIDEDMSNDEKEKFYAKLHKKHVKFEYRKISDNAIVKANGTLIASELPKPKISGSRKLAREKMKRTFPKDSVFYFDVDEQAFKSFKMKNFIKYL